MKNMFHFIKHPTTTTHFIRRWDSEDGSSPCDLQEARDHQTELSLCRLLPTSLHWRTWLDKVCSSTTWASSWVRGVSWYREKGGGGGATSEKKNNNTSQDLVFTDMLLTSWLRWSLVLAQLWTDFSFSSRVSMKSSSSFTDSTTDLKQ